MKIILALFVFFSISISISISHANNIIVNGTRFIYSEETTEITIQMSNSGDSPSLAQVWLDNGDAGKLPEEISTPFIISPPIARIDAKNGQSIRIKKATDKRIAANDRESLWWLNILDIPSVDKSQATENAAILNLAIRSRFKFFWRPIGLGDRQNAESKMEFIATSDGITLVNPTPFFITVVDIVSASGNGLLKESIMVAPKSKTQVNSKQKIKPGEPVVLQAVSDYGSVVEFKTAINKEK